MIDDILDSGRTLTALRARLMAERPASVRSCVLLDKPSRRQIDVPVEWRGLVVPDCFVVGYGLDFDGRYRNLPNIARLDDRAARRRRGVSRGRRGPAQSAPGGGGTISRSMRNVPAPSCQARRRRCRVCPASSWTGNRRGGEDCTSVVPRLTVSGARPRALL